MIRFAIPAALVVVSACATSPRAPAAATPASADAVVGKGSVVAHGVVFPGKVHRYTLTEATEVEARPDDKVFRYSDGSDTRVTVFFYRADSAMAAENPQQALAQEGQSFLESLPISVQRGWLDSYSAAVARTDSVTVDGRVVPGHITEVVAKRSGRSNMELQYVFLIAPRFVKVRASVPTEAWPNPDVTHFAHELATVLARQVHGTPPPSPGRPRNQ